MDERREIGWLLRWGLLQGFVPEFAHYCVALEDGGGDVDGLGREGGRVGR